MRLVSALVIALSALALPACESRECVRYNDCGPDAYCTASGRCAEAAPRAFGGGGRVVEPQPFPQSPDVVEECAEELITLNGSFGQAGATEGAACMTSTDWGDGYRDFAVIRAVGESWYGFVFVSLVDASSLPAVGEPPAVFDETTLALLGNAQLCADTGSGDHYDAVADSVVIEAIADDEIEASGGTLYRLDMAYGGDMPLAGSGASWAQAYFIVR